MKSCLARFIDRSVSAAKESVVGSNYADETDASDKVSP